MEFNWLLIYNEQGFLKSRTHTIHPLGIPPDCRLPSEGRRKDRQCLYLGSKDYSPQLPCTVVGGVLVVITKVYNPTKAVDSQYPGPELLRERTTICTLIGHLVIVYPTTLILINLFFMFIG